MPADLVSMPFEIREAILYWLQQLPATRPIKNKHTGPIHIEFYFESRENARRRKFQKISDSLPLIDLQSLVSVNRAFNRVFSYYLYKGLDLQGFPVDRLKFTLEGILKRHSDQVQNLRWRLSDFSKERQELNSNPQWDAKLRSELLLKILESCPHLIGLDIDLDPRAFSPKTRDSPLMYPGPSETSDRISNQMPNLFIRPISQLTSLSHLSLKSPSDRPPYTENFLVEILSNLAQLQSFTCFRITASHPETPEQREASQSPLGLHLASLTQLVKIHLEKAQCLDSSWNSRDWKSSLEALSLVDCDRVSLSVLHDFIEPFASTLTSLMFHNISLYRKKPDTDSMIQALKDGKLQINLFRLANLDFSSYLPFEFFQHSKNLSFLSLGLNSNCTSRFLEHLIRDKIWSNLNKLEIMNAARFLSSSEVEGLKVLCQQHSIEIIFKE